ncbi:MAG TPA: lycopene cyclase domain-containing protein [Ktedonobacterales bacterium]|jgi:lycopene beta-cyclase|nr:lycopene cyclase domain-containing protein [Ktedonobacterales bacterium]
MTYAAFLALFLLAPLLVLALVLRGRLLRRRYLLLALALTAIALAYMAPWDHLAAVWGLWTWAPGRTWGIRLWAIPPEEYLFCLLEALLATTLTYTAFVWRRARREKEPVR